MKLLLLTDCPPCKNFTGGLVLDQLCRFLEPGSIVCFAAINPDIKMELTPDLDWIPIRYATKPVESRYRGGFGGPLSALSAMAVEMYRRQTKVPPLIDQAVTFATSHGVDAIWAVLEGQTMVSMAVPVADRLGLPLYTLVWDPLSWWLSENEVDAWNTRLSLREFRRALKRSEACAVASWAMAEVYEREYGVRSIPIIASHELQAAANPTPSLHRGGELVIGMAGQFYATREWHDFVEILNTAGWCIAGREVRIKVLGHFVPESAAPVGRLEFLGWKTQSEAIKILADETDVLYCPYPFDAERDEVARLSFPSKLPLYFAAGRPVVFHGPAHSSPAAYIREHGVGLVCPDANGEALTVALTRLSTDPELYRLLAMRAQEAFRRDFTLDTMRSNFYAFLDRHAKGSDPIVDNFSTLGSETSHSAE